MRILLMITAFLGLVSVILGAYLEHSISNQSEEMIKAVRTGLRYHQLYVPILLALCLYGLALDKNSKSLKTSIIFFMIGLMAFSGSLYAYFWTGLESLTYLTPFGGVSLMIGWVLLVISAISNKDKSNSSL